MFEIFILRKIVDYMIKNNTRMTEQSYAWLVQAFARKG